MRGKESSRRWSTTPTLITPACAGKRDHVSIMLKAFGDHPRMCGEKISLVIRLKTKMGSPPHVRGKDISAGTIARTLGITPACAGKRSSMLWVTGCCKGSPPHVRGKGSRRHARRWSTGITPACAGKSTLKEKRQKHSGDHPRMCGEKTKKIP